MSGKLSEYVVQEILSNGNYGETCYKVKHKKTDSIMIWKAYDCKSYNKEQLNIISEEVKCIKSSDNDYIIKYYETIVHSPSKTLYIVTELYPQHKLTKLIDKCKAEHINFDEPFIWRCLYQIASAVKHLCKLNVNILQKQISIDNLYMNEEFNVMLDAFHLSPTQEKSICHGDICKIGEILYEVCILVKRSDDVKDKVKFRYSEDLQNMVNILNHNITKQNDCLTLKPDIILHHPTVLINLQNEIKQMFESQYSIPNIFANNDSAFESDESIHKLNMTLRKIMSTENVNDITSTPRNMQRTLDVLEYKSIPTASHKETYIGNQLSPTLIALDLKIPGYVPRKESEHVKKWRSRLELCKEPQEVSEQALTQVWLKRLAELRKREEALIEKEFEMTKEKIKTKTQDNTECNEDISDICSSMAGITLQPSFVQKVYKDEGIAVSNIKNNHDRRRSNRQSLSDGSVASDKSRPGSRNKHQRTSSVKMRSRKKKSMHYEDLNSSLSADPGDSSMIQTSKKISSDRVPRPKSIHNIQRRKVHFNNKDNPFAEYDTVSSTVLTFFDIENLNASYETPINPPSGGSLADRIAKFSYLDLEKMTNEKRALLEEIRKTPPKVNRATKPKLKSMVKNTKIIGGIQESTNTRIYSNDFHKTLFVNDNRPPSSLSKTSGCSSQSASSRRSLSSINRDDYKGNTPPFISVCKDERRKPIVVDIDIEEEFNIMGENKENSTDVSTPAPKFKKDSKRRSILGFKTPFRFRL